MDLGMTNEMIKGVFIGRIYRYWDIFKGSVSKKYVV